ncbi:MAG: hypothetical protein GKR94_30585 [Gammaproteobacteria bacterium]|nr:hypothetical protein [Gammaproteobacteria bacterium]
MTTTNNRQQDFIDVQDDFNRLLAQTQSLLIALTANDNFKSLKKDSLADALWLVMDRLDDIGKAYQQTVNIMAWRGFIIPSVTSEQGPD